MESRRAEIEAQLNNLRIKAFSDFSALAWIEDHENRLQWKYASGNSNDRYKRMSTKRGRGLVGLVVRHGRMMVLDQTDEDLSIRRKEFPIMLAENLHAVIAVPVIIYGETRGVLLTGNRELRVFTGEDIEKVNETAAILANIYIQENNDRSIG